MCSCLFLVFFLFSTSEMTLQTSQPSEILIWPLSQAECEAPESNTDPAAQRENKESAVVLLPFLWIKSESDACSESSWLQLHPCNSPVCTHMHVHTNTKTVRDREGTSWFRVRPGRRVHKAMGTAGHRREDERSSAEMWRAEGWN